MWSLLHTFLHCTLFQGLSHQREFMCSEVSAIIKHFLFFTTIIIVCFKYSPRYFKIKLLENKWNIFPFSLYEKVKNLCEKSLSEFSSNLYVLRPLSQKKRFIDRIIELDWNLAQLMRAHKERTRLTATSD